MCGLVGIAGDLSLTDEATMKRLLIMDYFRGTDSTGLATLRKNGETRLAKVASNPIDLFDTKRFTEALSGYQSLVFMGHNRAATKGKVTNLNAHPFHCGNVIGAHNGTLDLASWKRLTEALGYETDVDSQAVIACIDKIGIDETAALMQEGVSSVDGAWALTWIDIEKKELCFLRNKHRPLWFAYSDDFKKLFWASEWPMIRAATDMSDKNPYKLFADDKGFSFFEVYTDYLYRFNLEELRAGPTERPKPRVREVKGKEPKPVTTMGTPPFLPQGTNRWVPPTKTTMNGSGAGTTESRYTKSPAVYHIPGCSDEHPFGDYMGRGEFSVYAQYGCAWCKDEVKYEDRGITIYEPLGKVLCTNCSDNNGTTRLYTPGPEIVEFAKKVAADKIAAAA